MERIWVEVNGRVNYPVKACLVDMEENGDFDMECPIQKYCVSWFTIRVCAVGTKLVVSSWNEHTIPGCIYYTCINILHYFVSTRS